MQIDIIGSYLHSIKTSFQVDPVLHGSREIQNRCVPEHVIPTEMVEGYEISKELELVGQNADETTMKEQIGFVGLSTIVLEHLNLG